MRVLPLVIILVIHAWLGLALWVAMLWHDTQGSQFLGVVNGFSDAFYPADYETGNRNFVFQLSLNPITLFQGAIGLVVAVGAFVSLEVYDGLFTGNWVVTLRVMQLVIALAFTAMVWPWIPILAGHISRLLGGFVGR